MSRRGRVGVPYSVCISDFCYVYTTTLYVYNLLGYINEEKKDIIIYAVHYSMRTTIGWIILHAVVSLQRPPQSQFMPTSTIRPLKEKRQRNASQRALPLSLRVGMILAIISSLVIRWSIRSRWLKRLFMSLLHSFSTSSASRGLEKLISRAGRSILA